MNRASWRAYDIMHGYTPDDMARIIRWIDVDEYGVSQAQVEFDNTAEGCTYSEWLAHEITRRLGLVSMMSTAVDDEQCAGWKLQVDGSWNEDPHEPGDDTTVAWIFDQGGKAWITLEAVSDLGSVSIGCPVAVLRKLIDSKDPTRA